MGVRLTLHSPSRTTKQLQARVNSPRRRGNPYSLIDVAQQDAALVWLVSSRDNIDVVRLLMKRLFTSRTTLPRLLPSRHLP